MASVHEVDRLERKNGVAAIVDHLVCRHLSAAIVPASRRAKFEDLRTNLNPVTGAKSGLHSVIVKADAAYKVDVAVDAMVKLAPDSEHLDSASDDLAKDGVACCLWVGVEPLRVILARELDDLLLADLAPSRLADFSGCK